MNTENDFPKYSCLEELWPRLDAGMGCGGYIGKGWYDLVRKLDVGIAEIYPDYVLDQIKEKFGGLRFYIAPLPETLPQADRDKIYALIRVAEDESEITCDICGKRGKRELIGEYLIATRCENHNEELDYV